MVYDNGEYQITKIGKSRKLVTVSGYRWQNSDGNTINEVECKVKEYGNEEYVGEEEQHDLVDINECDEGIESALCPMKNSKCDNIPGSYRCVCNNGYMPFDNSKCTYRNNIKMLRIVVLCDWAYLNYCFLSETYKCRAGSSSTNSNNLLCVKNCSLSDPVHGSSKVVFGESKYLESEPGYQWTNTMGQNIDSVKCDFYDFGGIYESIKLDYKWKCIDGYFQLGDSSCKGKLF